MAALGALRRNTMAADAIDLLALPRLTGDLLAKMRKYAYYGAFDSALRQRAARICTVPCDWRREHLRRPRHVVLVVPHILASTVPLLNRTLVGMLHEVHASRHAGQSSTPPRAILVCLNKVYDHLEAKLSLIAAARAAADRARVPLLTITWSALVAERHRGLVWVPFGVPLSDFTLPAEPVPYEMRAHDIFFSGSLQSDKYPLRPNAVAALQAEQRLRGDLTFRYPRHYLEGHSYLAEFNRTRMVLSTVGFPRRFDLVGTRFFEVMASGGPLLVCDRGADSSYRALGIVENETAVMFSSDTELVRVVRHYAARPKEASAIIRRAREVARARHSWAQRAEQVVAALRPLLQGPHGARNVEAAASTSPAATTLRRVLGDSTPLLQLHEQAARLRVYVYDPPTSARWSDATLIKRFPKCATFQWSGDFSLLQRLRSSPQSTRDGSSADFFVVPFLAKCYFNYVAKYTLSEMDVAMKEIVSFLRLSPWFDRSPERHLFFFMSGVGADVVPSWRQHLARSIFIVAEGDRQAECFREGHDIVVPGKLSVPHREHQRRSTERTLLAAFRGTLNATLRDAHGRPLRRPHALRQQLGAYLRDEPDVRFSHIKSLSRYVQELDDARFCIIPRGNTPWTRRFFDAVVRGCIPAVLSDPVAFPFERLLDFRAMTIKLPEQWAHALAHELRAVDESAHMRLQQQLQRMWPAFVYSEGGVAFDLLLIEMTARLSGFYRSEGWRAATPNSPTRFWSPMRGAFELPNASKVGPSWGAGARPHRS